MKAHPLHLSLPQPCTQDWNDMRPEAQGRFCDHCQKTVTDFSKMTDTALLAYVQQHGLGCGRFRQDQLDRVITLPEVRPSRFWQRLLLTAGMLFGLQKIAGAQRTKPATTTVPTPPAAIDTLLTIEGVVRDQEGLPASDAMVRIKDGNTGEELAAGVTDADGYYRIPILKEQYEGKVVAVNYHFLLDELNTTIQLDQCRNVRNVMIPATFHQMETIRMGGPMSDPVTINMIERVTLKKHFRYKVHRLLRRTSKQKGHHSK